MPGVVGLITTMPSAQAEHELQTMLGTMAHESSNVFGSWCDRHLGVYIGWTVRRGSCADRMPLRNERGDLVLAFSGEEFPDPETVRSLKARGHEIEPGGPSYLVHVCEEDPSFPASLNGRFHGLAVNLRERRSTLFNDRYGMHRMYYYQGKEGFYFAAEAKALLAVHPQLRKISLRSLGEMVGLGCVLENRTLFDGVQVLPPAAAWVFQNGSLERKGIYFQPRDWEQQQHLDKESYYQELRATFSRNLSRYFNANEPIGISLTGGLDTRMIMAWQKLAPESVPCYTFGGMARECEDVRVARRVAAACGQPHQVIGLDQEFLRRFPYYAERTVYLTDGCADVYRAPDLYLNERAAQIAPVRITGNYGSEVLRAVRAFKPLGFTSDLFSPELMAEVHAASERYTALLRSHPLSFAVFQQAPWHHYGLLALEQTQVAVRSPYLDNDLVRTVFRAPNTVFQNSNLCLRLIAEGNAALGQLRTDRGLASQNRIVSKATRSYLEFTFKAEYAYDYGMPQWVCRLDHRLAPLHVERLFLGKHKFSHFRVWYRDVLSGYVKDMLLDSRTRSRPYLIGKTLEAIVNAHVSGRRNYTREIHKVLTLELLERLFIDHEPPSLGEVRTPNP